MDRGNMREQGVHYLIAYCLNVGATPTVTNSTTIATGKIAVATATPRHLTRRKSQGKIAQIRATTGNATMPTAMATTMT
jgi:hypothetical protein